MTVTKTSKSVSLSTQQYSSRSSSSSQKTLCDLYVDGLQHLRKFNFFLELGGTGHFAPLRVFVPRRVTIEGLSLPSRFQPLWELSTVDEESHFCSAINRMPPDLRDFWEPLVLTPDRLQSSSLGGVLSRISEVGDEVTPVGPNFTTPPTDATVCASLLTEVLTLAPADQVVPYAAFFEACLHSEPLSERRARLTREVNRLKDPVPLHSSPHE